MPINSGFNSRLIDEINDIFPLENNLFVWKDGSHFADYQPNCMADSRMFSAEYLNAHCAEYNHIFLHSLYMKDAELLVLSDEAASKITWVVWGHDLYRVKKPVEPSFRSIAYHSYKFLQQFSPFYLRRKAKAAAKVGRFERIAIGYSYDEHMIRKKYGPDVPVVCGPYFSKPNPETSLENLRKLHLAQQNDSVRVMIGHCGGTFVQHEKYLKKLAKYRNENIHIVLVLSYLASKDRIKKLEFMAHSLFGAEKCTILKESMPREEYFKFLTTIDIAIFPYKHQSGLANIRRLLYMGTKLYFDPRGVLAKGLLECGAPINDCRRIGKDSFEEFCKKDDLVNRSSALFDSYNYEKNVSAWRCLLLE